MTNGQNTVRLKNKDQELHVSQTITDSPLLPIAQIEHLKQILPDRVDWVFEQTEAESTFRRTELKRTNTFVFVERLLGQIFGFILASLALVVAGYCAVNGYEFAASVIGGSTVVGLVYAFKIGTSKDNAPVDSDGAIERKPKGRRKN